ncbi:MAG: Crp/Fnr family transcriptional regulator [Tissierellales bacterium]|nr:Crp/Fnr family transcriptional regulator [Tissierellales bacterium]MBN2826576.1 Crp/Fnr family transcriptional regulator [Tissierellales bacterium]
MLKEFFNQDNQNEMTTYFLDVLSHKGIEMEFKKDAVIQTDPDCVYVVKEGMVSREIFSKDGKQATLFLLVPGTIFGEMEFFDNYKETCVSSIAIYHHTVVSKISRALIEKELTENLKVYKYFMHSITRKYNILLMKVADTHFNDFRGKLASTLIRFSIIEEGDFFDGAHIKNIKSITMFAKYLSCNRSTLSSTLSEFQDEGIISLEKNIITIIDKDKLIANVNFIW